MAYINTRKAETFLISRIAALPFDSYKTRKRDVPWKRRSQRRAVSIVETALILPIVVILVFGLLEYGWLFVRTQQITNAARHGARIAAREGATLEDAKLAVLTLLQRYGLNVPEDSIEFTPESLDDMPVGDTLSVSIAVPYESTGLGIPMFTTLNLIPQYLRASASMAREGP